MASIRTRALAAAIAAAVVLVAVLLLVGRGGSRSAAAATSGGSDTVTVVGVGTADGAPDTLTVDFTVHVTRGTVQDALDSQAVYARRVFAALQRSGVARKDVKTTDLELNRHYDNHGNPSGFDGSETVEAKISPLTHAGRTITAGATAAPGHVDVGNMSFDVMNDDALLASARSNAYADAKTRAQQYAQLAGRSLGPVVKISETVDEGGTPDKFVGEDFAAGAGTALRAAPVPLRAGQQTLTVHVTVVWSLT